MDQVFSYSVGHSPRLTPLGFDSATDVCARSPFIPSLQEVENIISYEMSNWQAPELAPMRREHRSGIARAIASGKCKPPPRPTDKIIKYNPYLKAQRDADRDAQRSQQRNPPTRAPQYRVFNGAPRHGGAPSTSTTDITMRGISSSIHAPSTGIFGRHPSNNRHTVRFPNSSHDELDLTKNGNSSELEL
ncbi:hypothetical protein K438DRAFT_274660 [Mycena galopus ATCC 62051]|nr:hypothetical protein K438DRAFT_274660 [Mycena galopus ATCC 62051]